MIEQEKRENAIKGLECCGYSIFTDKCQECPYDGEDCFKRLKADAVALLKAQEPITGETSDGYHTFNELYHHRAVLFSVIVSVFHDRAWKSKKHHDGTMFDGMFIVGIDTPDGQATYHYDVDPYWDMFDCKVREFAPEWDGHTPAQAIERIGKLKAQEPRVMTLEEVTEDKPDVVWFDDRHYKLTYPAFVSNGEVTGWIVSLSNGCLERHDHIDGYGKEWRCWTSRPTDAQREAIPWE